MAEVKMRGAGTTRKYADPAQDQPKPDGPWYLKYHGEDENRSYIVPRADETILNSIAVDRDKWNAYNSARRGLYPCVDCPELCSVGCCWPWNALFGVLFAPCGCAAIPWSNCCQKYEDVPYPEGARGEEALVLTDVGIRGWSEKKAEDSCCVEGWNMSTNPHKGVEWEPVGITWDNIKDPIVGADYEPGIELTRTGGSRCTFVNTFVQCCGPDNPPLADPELNFACFCGIVIYFCEFVVCQGSAPGSESKLQSYYKLTLNSGSVYRVWNGQDSSTYSDVTITARGLETEAKALIETIVERAVAARAKSSKRSRMEPPSQMAMDRAVGLC